MNIIKTMQDSVTPEADPIAEKGLDSQSQESLQHIENNSKRAFFWKQMAQYSLTMMAIFGGIAIGGTAVMPAATALTVACGLGVMGLASSLAAHRIDMKNEISMEELHAKRTGQCVAESIEEKTAALENFLAQTHMQPTAAEGLNTLRGGYLNAPTNVISSDQLVGEQIHIPQDRVLH